MPHAAAAAPAALALVLLVRARPVSANDNGLGGLPPMGK